MQLEIKSVSAGFCPYQQKEKKNVHEWNTEHIVLLNIKFVVASHYDDSYICYIYFNYTFGEEEISLIYKT